MSELFRRGIRVQLLAGVLQITLTIFLGFTAGWCARSRRDQVGARIPPTGGERRARSHRDSEDIPDARPVFANRRTRRTPAHLLTGIERRREELIVQQTQVSQALQ